MLTFSYISMRNGAYFWVKPSPTGHQGQGRYINLRNYNSDILIVYRANFTSSSLLAELGLIYFRSYQFQHPVHEASRYHTFCKGEEQRSSSNIECTLNNSLFICGLVVGLGQKARKQERKTDVIGSPFCRSSRGRNLRRPTTTTIT